MEFQIESLGKEIVITSLMFVILLINQNYTQNDLDEALLNVLSKIPLNA